MEDTRSDGSGFVSAAVAWAIVVGGGMWAVTWANSIMILVSLLSMLVLFGATAYGIGEGDAVAGWSRVIDAAPKDHFRIDAASFEKCFAVAAGATLSQASIVSRNVIKPLRGSVRDSAGGDSPWVARVWVARVWVARVWVARVWGTRARVGLVIAGSLAVAFSGESIMGLLELSLVLVLVSLFVPMTLALFFPSQQARPGVGNSAMIAGFVAWSIGFAFESRSGVPASLVGLSARATAGWLAMRSGGTR